MAHSLTKYEIIYLLMSQNGFTMVSSVSEDFICIICRNLLINAFQGTCGCDYCYRCIDDHLKTGATFCPGHSDECQMANLSDIVPDHRMNKQINQLIVKCSEETCSYECQLAKIDEHLRLCPKKSVKCPFYEFGCNHEGRSQERFCTESNDHNNILIDTIGNLKNEIIDLKNITQKSNFEIENLNDNLIRKNAKIESLEAKMKLIEDALQFEVQGLMGIFYDKSDYKMGQKEVETFDEAASFREVNEGHIDRGIQLRNARYKMVEKVTNEIGDISNEMTSLVNVNESILEGELIEGNEEFRAFQISEINIKEHKLDKNIIGQFTWTMNNIKEWTGEAEVNFSDYFYGSFLLYYMRLRSWNCGNQLRLYLRLYRDDTNGNVLWPFEGLVTMTIANEVNLQSNMTLTKFCQIKNPLDKNYRSSCPFRFYFDELSNLGLLQGDRLTLSCVVQVK